MTSLTCARSRRNAQYANKTTEHTKQETARCTKHSHDELRSMKFRLQAIESTLEDYWSSAHPLSPMQ